MKNLFYFVLGCIVGSYTMYNKLYKHVVTMYMKSNEQAEETDD